jgi:hypothetical protein
MSFASVAQGAIAGGGQQFSTNRPDVVSATVNNTLITPYVDLCFDVPIVPDPGMATTDFALTGVNVAETINPDNVSTNPSNTSCLRLLFPASTNLGSYTVVEVQAGAVRPAGGGALTNIEASARLDNTDVAPVIGRIGGPNLVSTIPVDVGGPYPQAVQYTFDKNIGGVGGGGIDPTLFGYFSPDGEFTRGFAIAPGSPSGKSVIILFNISGDDPTPSSAVSYYVLSDAVGLADRPDSDNANRAESIGGKVSGRPQLLSVSEVPGQQGSYDLQYDQLIQPLDLRDCRAVMSVGPSYRANHGQVIGNGSVLRVTYDELLANNFGSELNSDDEVVRISDEGRPDDGCVQDINTSRASSTKSVALRLGDNIPGFTSGPDLTGCIGSPTSNEVTFVFDELLSLNLNGGISANDFRIKSTTGGNVDGQSIRDITENTVTVIFQGGTMVNAAACTVHRGAVVDRDPRIGLGIDVNPLGTVRFNSDGTTPVGTIPVNEGTVFVPVPGPATNTTTPGPTTTVIGAIVRKTPQSLTLNAKCKSLGGGKYRCSVSGKLTQANSVRALGRSKACTGTVKVQYKSGTKTVSTRLRTIKHSTCTYKGTVTFTKPERLRSGLKVRARYNGNKYAKTKYSRTVFVISR